MHCSPFEFGIAKYRSALNSHRCTMSGQVPCGPTEDIERGARKCPVFWLTKVYYMKLVYGKNIPKSHTAVQTSLKTRIGRGPHATHVSLTMDSPGYRVLTAAFVLASCKWWRLQLAQTKAERGFSSSFLTTVFICIKLLKFVWSASTNPTQLADDTAAEETSVPWPMTSTRPFGSPIGVFSTLCLSDSKRPEIRQYRKFVLPPQR